VNYSLLLAERKCPHIELISPENYYGCQDWKKWRQESPVPQPPFYKGKVLVGNHEEDNRDCPVLVGIIEELGKEANNSLSELKIIEIPDDVEWEIQEYNGVEWVAEKHRKWF
jgi:hypothetical protein